MMLTTEQLSPVLGKLEQHASWAEEDRAAFLRLPFARNDLKAGAYLSRQGDRLTTCGVLLSGFAYLHRILPDGLRQIVSVRMAGDFLNLQGGMLETAGHNVQMLTPARIALVPVDALDALAAERPAIQRSLWRSTLVDSAILSEWITNVGRRDARARIAHLLCEFAVRLRSIGHGADLSYPLPMTQEQIGDATGLTPVHVNRTLQKLRREGLIAIQTRAVTIKDWIGLSRAARFDETYLCSSAIAA